MGSWARAWPEAFSQSCERFSRFRRFLAGAGLALCALAVAGSAQAAPEDDFRAGEQAYRRGDVVAAMASLRRAADAGHAPAQVMLAGILDQAEFDEDAVAYYRKAADQGNADGQYGMGTMYLAGEGVKRDAAQGYFWLTRAADNDGHARAILALATAHIRAQKGEIAEGPDKARAAEWLRKAADFNDQEALDALAKAYREGGFGLAPDAQLAEQFAARAAAVRKQLAAVKAKKKK